MTYPLLFDVRAAGSALPPPKLFITSSLAASTGSVPDMFINGAYGSTKAAANYIARGIHRQTENFGAVVIPYHPGKQPQALCSFRLQQSVDRYRRNRHVPPHHLGNGHISGPSSGRN